MITQRIKYKAVECRKTVTNIIVDKNVAFGSDSWTLDANDTYIGATMYLIEENLELKSFPLGIVKKESRAQAVHQVREIEALYAMLDLEYKNVIVNVTDTEATMVVSSTLFKQHAAGIGVPEHVLVSL